jgi:hypothetical protein
VQVMHGLSVAKEAGSGLSLCECRAVLAGTALRGLQYGRCLAAGLGIWE